VNQRMYAKRLIYISLTSPTSTTEMQATSLSYFDTEYSADSIEFCPNRPQLFACGTYQVVKSDQPQPTEQEEEAAEIDPTVTRYGRCLLYELSEGGNKV